MTGRRLGELFTTAAIGSRPMDKDLAARFVDMFLGVMRTEIAEASARAQRLSDAAAHNVASRDEAQALLVKVRSQRQERERRLLLNGSYTED